jgi:peptidoglycan/xylan/chitin deacetylase (PgdA/CDA1 family)
MPRKRAAAYTQAKRHVKDLAHVETLATTREVCAALRHESGRHEVLGWDELRDLAAQGVTLGAHTRTHPRLDRVPRAEARAEVLGSLADIERELPGAARVFAYPDGRFDDELVELLRAARVELAFTTRRGTNDLHRSDRLRLRRINVDALDPLPVFRAKLAASAARLAPAVRLLDPPSKAERRSERAQRAERRRSQVVLRSLDAALTAPLRAPAGSLAELGRVLAPRTPHYERVGRGVRLLERAWPGLEERLVRALLAEGRLPFRAAAPELVGCGSGATVFRLRLTGEDRSLALKIYRRTLGREPRHLAAAARRYRQRFARLSDTFGEIVLPAHFLVLHAPLRGVRAVACIQPWLEGELVDLLALDDPELARRLQAHPELAARFVQFARAFLAWRARGIFPDVAGRGNLCAVPGPGGPSLRLIDYGIFDPYHHASPPAEVIAEMERLSARLDRLLERSPLHGVPA